MANEMRRRSLGKMLNLGKDGPAAYNFDGSHRMVLDDLLKEHGMDAASDAQRRAIWWDGVHNLQCWPDFPPDQ